MVYMAADNNLYRDAKANLAEMLHPGSTAQMNVVVQKDGPRPGKSVRYFLGSEGRAIEQPPYQVENLNRELRLEEFLSWCGREYPAERYFLVLWGHGEGLDRLYTNSRPRDSRLIGLAEDDSPESGVPSSLKSELKEALRITFAPVGVMHEENANRYLKDVQLGTALKTFTLNNRKIDLLGFDACLMGMAEICHEIRDCVSFVVASADTIPSEGWPYHLILTDLARNPGMDPPVLSAVIVNRYIQSYSKRAKRVSLSSFDLTACDELAKKMRCLVTKLKDLCSDGSSDHVRKLCAARDASQCFEERDYIDLFIFCRSLQQSFANHAIGETAKQIIEILVVKPYVIYHDHSDLKKLKDSEGLSIYFPTQLDVARSSKEESATAKEPPHSGKGEIAEYQVIWPAYKELKFCKFTGWAAFLEVWDKRNRQNTRIGEPT